MVLYRLNSIVLLILLLLLFLPTDTTHAAVLSVLSSSSLWSSIFCVPVGGVGLESIACC